MGWLLDLLVDLIEFRFIRSLIKEKRAAREAGRSISRESLGKRLKDDFSNTDGWINDTGRYARYEFLTLPAIVVGFVALLFLLLILGVKTKLAFGIALLFLIVCVARSYWKAIHEKDN